MFNLGNETARTGEHPYVMLVDQACNVVATNYGSHSGKVETPHGDKRPGSIVGCVHAFGYPDGCGTGSLCARCPLRSCLNTIFQTKEAIAPHTVEMHLSPIGPSSQGYRIVHFSVEGNPITVDDGIFALLTLYDIDHELEVRRKMEEAKIKTDEAERSKSAFLLGMSHEIRTPLNAIVGFSELMTRTDDKSQQREFAQIIAHNNHLLLQLINDVLDMAKIESNSIDIHEQPTDINQLIISMEEGVKRDVHPNVVVNYVLGAPSCVAVIDPARVRQVMESLLSNACKFTTFGSVTYGYELNDEELLFFVKDTGPGLSAEEKDRVFERFHKNDGFTQGAGIGLSVSKGLVEAMKGEIGVESRGHGRGCRFWFAIPFVESHSSQIAPEPVVSNHDIPTDAPAHPTMVAPGEKVHDATILIAEDNPSNYLLFQHILQNHYNLIHANDGWEAVQLCREHNPDLILMDINMPNMDGYEATTEIRKFNQTVPIIAVTAYAFASDRRRIVENGFNCYISKPINPQRLEAEISSRIKQD